MPPPLWVFNPYAAALLAMSLISIALVGYSLNRRWIPAAEPFSVIAMCMIAWGIGAALQVSTRDLNVSLFGAAMAQIGFTFIGPSWFLFACRFIGLESWRSLRVGLMVYALPALMLLLFWTTGLHGLMFTDPQVVTTSAGYDLAVQFQAGFWVHTVIAYAFILVGTVMLLGYAFTSAHMYRLQIAAILLASVAPLISNLLTITGTNPLPLDPMPLAFGLSLLCFAVSIFSFKFFDLVPISYSKLLSTLREGVIVLDERNRIVQINPAAVRLLNESADPALIGRDIAQYIGPWMETFAPYLQMHEMRGEIQIDTPNLGRRWFDLHTVPFIERGHRHERVRGRMVVLSEVTARKLNELELAQARDRALQLDQFKTRLLSNISHDLRTPLAAIWGMTELLRSGLLENSPSDREHALKTVYDNAVYLNQLVEQLINQSELNAGRIVIRHEAFAPADLIARTVANISILAEMKGLTLSHHIEPGLPPELFGDAERVQQVMTNLLGNAIKYSERGSVTLTAARIDSAHWGFEVRDTGPGIPPDLHAIIFEPFRQINPVSGPAGRERGFGLGLSIVKDLVSLMGGTVTVESQPGAGSTFRVSLPLETTPRTPAPAAPAALAG
jgi:signal transduction histidine kinase